MSFTELKIAELKKVADSFGIELESAKTKQEIVALLEEEGVTYQMYDKFNNVEKVNIERVEKKEKKSMKKEDLVLVKMDRENGTYQSLGHTFTALHPFIAMSETDAQRIFDLEEGFRLATPREAQEFYS
jgi:hypothetical protein